MPRFAWMTDIHLEFLLPHDIDAFLKTVSEAEPDGVFITGDISQAAPLRSHLLQMAAALAVPVFFVLGNHDYYGGSIAGVRAAMRALHAENRGPVWLPEAGVVTLAEDAGLVGHGCPSDGRYGDFLGSDVMLNDYFKIHELSGISAEERLQRLNALGDDAAGHLRRSLPAALDAHACVFVLMHSPPFIEACWYEGQTPELDNPYLPHFTCKAAGDALLEAADAYPEREIIVLCGHVHHAGEATLRDNLRVITGSAEYGQPVIQRVLTV